MGKGLTIAGFVLSIIGILTAFIFWYASLPASIVGLVLSIVGGKKLKAAGSSRGLAIAGMVISIVSLSLSALMTACAVCAILALA